MTSAFQQLVKEVTHTGTWEATSESEMIAALEDAEDIVNSLQGSLQKCVGAMTEVLRVSGGLSIEWAVLRHTVVATRQAIDKCGG